MIIIREEQMKVFEEAAMNRFYDQILSDLKKPEGMDIEIIYEDTLRHFVKKTVSRASEHGLTTERNIYSFVLCALKFGENFYVNQSFFAAIFEEHKGNETIIGRYLKLASN